MPRPAIARREEGAYRQYSTPAERSPTPPLTGCIGGPKWEVILARARSVGPGFATEFRLATGFATEFRLATGFAAGFDAAEIALSHIQGGPSDKDEHPLAVYLAPRDDGRIGLIIQGGEHVWAADFSVTQ